MKKSVFVYGSLLAALLAEGADLTREQIDAKLAQLARSRAPTKLSPGATCYDMAVPRLQREEFTCSKCGTKTIYQAWEWSSTLSTARHLHTQAALMRKLELNIQLDDSDFCAKCSPIKEILTGTVYWKNAPEKLSLAKIPLPPGTKVKLVLTPSLMEWILVPELWVQLSEFNEGKISQRGKIYTAPSTTASALEQIPAGYTWRTEATRPDDPAGWVRLRGNNLYLDSTDETKSLKKPPVPTPHWIITIDGQTRKLPVQMHDDDILLAFLNGKNRFKAAMGNEVPLKSYLPRLLELLGKALKTEEKP